MGGKKADKAKDKAQPQGPQDPDDENRPLEPHTCNGHFANDFHELCRREKMAVIPPVVPRPRRPPSPSTLAAMEAKENKKADKNKQAPAPEPEPEPEVNEDGEPVEPPPKTYTTKDYYEFFKPRIQVEQDHPDKQETVTEVFIRGWKIDKPMMDILAKCFVTMERLHTINLWNTGLTAETLTILADCLPNVTNLKTLIIDNNPIKEENYHLLLKEESPLQTLVLRYNKITDSGAARLGECLGNVKQTNTKLVTLDLSNNLIGDIGAQGLAKGLRFNRTLLSLSLKCNHVTDLGAKNMAEVISRFFLTHEENVERRKLICAQERAKSASPPPSGRNRDRPPSTRSQTNTKKDTKKDTKDAKKGKEKEKEDTKGGTKKDKKDTVGKKASLTTDLKATTKGGKEKGGKSGKSDRGKTMIQEIEPGADLTEATNPLLESSELINGEIMIPGNRALINLNLARNEIGDSGLAELLKAVQWQTTLTKFSTVCGTGLMRLILHKNAVPSDSQNLEKLQTLMATKDPFYKPPARTPDDETSSEYSHN